MRLKDTWSVCQVSAENMYTVVRMGTYMRCYACPYTNIFHIINGKCIIVIILESQA